MPVSGEKARASLGAEKSEKLAATARGKNETLFLLLTMATVTEIVAMNRKRTREASQRLLDAFSSEDRKTD